MVKLDEDIYELGLTIKSLKALNDNNIFTIKDLVCLTHKDLDELKGVGVNIKADIMACLKKNNLHLGIR